MTVYILSGQLLMIKISLPLVIFLFFHTLKYLGVILVELLRINDSHIADLFALHSQVNLDYLQSQYIDCQRTLEYISTLDPVEEQDKIYLLRMSVYGKLPLIPCLKYNPTNNPEWPTSYSQFEEIGKFRHLIYNEFYKIFSSIMPIVDHMEFVVPSSIPLLVSEDLCQSIANKFAFRYPNLVSILHFDINRNVLRPNYIKSLVVNISDITSFSILDDVLKILSSSLLT